MKFLGGKVATHVYFINSSCLLQRYSVKTTGNLFPSETVTTSGKVFPKSPAAPATVPMKQRVKQLTESATQITNGDDKPPTPTKQSPAAKQSPAPNPLPVAKLSAPAKPSAKPTPSAMVTHRRTSTVSKTPAKEPVKSLSTSPEEQQNDDNSSDAFRIDRPRRTAVAAKPKNTPKLQVVTRHQRILNQAATAQGQRKLSHFYFVDPNDSSNLEYLPDIEHDVTFATGDVPCSCTIVISDKSPVSPNEGPRHVSSPTSDTQMFDYPMLSPINSFEDIVITDSSQDLFS